MHAKWWGLLGITKPNNDDKGRAKVDWTGKTTPDNVQGELIEPSSSLLKSTFIL
jgi:hypothetical protein